MLACDEQQFSGDVPKFWVLLEALAVFADDVRQQLLLLWVGRFDGGEQMLPTGIATGFRNFEFAQASGGSQDLIRD